MYAPLLAGYVHVVNHGDLKLDISSTWSRYRRNAPNTSPLAHSCRRVAKSKAGLCREKILDTSTASYLSIDKNEGIGAVCLRSTSKYKRKTQSTKHTSGPRRALGPGNKKSKESKNQMGIPQSTPSFADLKMRLPASNASSSKFKKPCRVTAPSQLQGISTRVYTGSAKRVRECWMQ